MEQAEGDEEPEGTSIRISIVAHFFWLQKLAWAAGITAGNARLWLRVVATSLVVDSAMMR